MRTVTEITALTRGNPTVVTIGTFDGVHRGHQWLMRRVVDRARTLDYDSLVITFDPSPAVVLRPGTVQLTGGDEKSRIIAAIGPTTLAVLPFTHETSQVRAGQFLGTLMSHVNLTEVWVGADFAFGHKREGDVDFLIRNGQRSGFSVMVVPRQSLIDVPISSTKVRELIHDGDVGSAARLLGHYASVRGTVVSGAGRGATLGFPTANVGYPPTQMLPAIGIYAGYLRADSERRPAAVSVGHNVVFGGESEVVVEAYVLDFDGDLRGKDAAVDFVARIRDELNFESVDALIAQMRQDVDQVRAILASEREPGELIL